MTGRPTLARMTRMVLGVVVAILLCACATSGSGTSEESETDGPPDARAAKAEMDAAAQAVLPALASKIGGQVSGLQAHFTERGGFGIWDYAADGHITKPPGTMARALDAAEGALTSEGYAVERDDAQKRVTGTLGNVRIAVEAGLLSDDQVVSSLNVRFGIIGAVSDGDDFAGSAPAEDYLAYVK